MKIKKKKDFKIRKQNKQNTKMEKKKKWSKKYKVKTYKRIKPWI